MTDTAVPTDAAAPSSPSNLRPETNRDRVRRLLLDPLGFRFRKGHDEAEGRRFLDGLADELAYMTDEALAALQRMVRVHGEGAAKAFWPDRPTFLGWAHAIQPRPLTEDPILLSWFGSVEGPRALEAGELVETYRYVERKRLPPRSDQARRLVAEKAAENARRLEVIADRRKFDLGVSPEELQWAEWYTGLRSRLEALVGAERAKRGHGE